MNRYKSPWNITFLSQLFKSLNIKAWGKNCSFNILFLSNFMLKNLPKVPVGRLVVLSKQYHHHVYLALNVCVQFPTVSQWLQDVDVIVCMQTVDEIWDKISILEVRIQTSLELQTFILYSDMTMYLAVTDTFITLTDEKSIHSSAFIALPEVTLIEKVPLSN